MSEDENSPCKCYKLALDANYDLGQASRRTLIRWAKMLSEARKGTLPPVYTFQNIYEFRA